MRILLVSSYFAPHVGGVEVVVEQQAAILAAAGHRVTVATTRIPSSLPARERRDGYEVVRLPASNLLERHTGIPYPVVGPAFWRGLREHVYARDIDPLQLYVSILSLCYVHVSNRYTLSITFNRDITDPGWLDARRRHVQQMVLAYLCGADGVRESAHA